MACKMLWLDLLHLLLIKPRDNVFFGESFITTGSTVRNLQPERNPKLALSIKLTFFLNRGSILWPEFLDKVN